MLLLTPTENQRIADAIIGDADALGSGTYSLHLSTMPLDPTGGTTGIPPTIGGYNPIGATDWIDGIDPVSGLRIMKLTPPSGGFIFPSLANGTFPTTAVALAVKNLGNGDIVGVQTLDPPVTFSGANQTYDAGSPAFPLPPL